MNLVPAIDKARLYRGKGGEVMREGVCRLATAYGHVRVPLSPAQHAKVRADARHCAPAVCGEGAGPGKGRRVEERATMCPCRPRSTLGWLRMLATVRLLRGVMDGKG